MRKVLRSGETSFAYERSDQPHPKLGLFIGRLETMLAANAAAAKKDRLTLTRIADLLGREGYAGSYDAVRRYARRWRDERRGLASAGEAFVPLSFAPGDAYQFDWSHEKVELGGMPMTVKVAHLRLSHSRRFYIRAYPRETQEMVFDAHARAFATFGGVPRRGIYDNMKTAVEAVFVWQGAAVQPALRADVLALPDRAGGVHAGVGLGEGPGGEPGRLRPGQPVQAAPEVPHPGGAERLAGRSVRQTRRA